MNIIDLLFYPKKIRKKYLLKIIGVAILSQNKKIHIIKKISYIWKQLCIVFY